METSTTSEYWAWVASRANMILCQALTDEDLDETLSTSATDFRLRAVPRAA